MISAILIHFYVILSKYSPTVGICLIVLSHSFFKSKIPLVYPKIITFVGLIIISILPTAKKMSEPTCQIKTNIRYVCRKTTQDSVKVELKNGNLLCSIQC